MRARQPDTEGYAEVDGIKIGYEVFGEGDVTLLFVPGWQLFQSRMWKAQVPFLSRRYRVITYDQPGSGRSDRVDRPPTFNPESRFTWPTAVLDATETDRRS